MWVPRWGTTNHSRSQSYSVMDPIPMELHLAMLHRSTEVQDRTPLRSARVKVKVKVKHPLASPQQRAQAPRSSRAAMAHRTVNSTQG